MEALTSLYCAGTYRCLWFPCLDLISWLFTITILDLLLSALPLNSMRGAVLYYSTPQPRIDMNMPEKMSALSSNDNFSVIIFRNMEEPVKTDIPDV